MAKLLMNKLVVCISLLVLMVVGMVLAADVVVKQGEIQADDDLLVDGWIEVDHDILVHEDVEVDDDVEVGGDIGLTSTPRGFFSNVFSTGYAVFYDNVTVSGTLYCGKISGGYFDPK